MAQNLLFDPIVTSGPTLVGTGNGTLTVNKLTHFTTAQTYTATCIATTPSVLFSIVGSVDGPVGIATQSVQFFDSDLKIFLTISPGPTAFIIGDQFTLTVTNGSDLNQDNIDSYDELPQKNFGLGTKGLLSGDHNLRYSSTVLNAYRYLQDLKFVAVTAGSSGNNIQIEYLNPLAGTSAAKTIQDLTYTAITAGVGGNSITMEYEDYTPAVAAELVVQNVKYVANTPGVGGNSIRIAYAPGGTAGSEIVSVVGNDITVTIQSGVSTALQIKTAVMASVPALALVVPSVYPNAGSNGTVQTAPVSLTYLTGGSDAIGSAGNEVVTVIGTAIKVKMTSSVSTANQIKAKVDAHPVASLLVTTTVSGVGTNTQTAPVAPTSLIGGVDGVGSVGNEVASVAGSLIQIRLDPGKSTATQVLAAINASAPALALITPSIVGLGANPQFGPISPLNLIGGKNKTFSFNHDEISDSGSFAEGNANVKMADALVQGQLKVDNKTSLGEVLSLEDVNSSINKSGDPVPNVQRYLNNLIQDNKITLRTADHTKITWNKPNLSFEANLVIDFTDSDFYNQISIVNSPISIADGQSIYVILDRDSNATLTPVVASTVPSIVNVFRIASRFGDNLILWDNSLVRDGKSVRIGESGEGGTLKVDFYNPVHTVLPTGASVTIDGISVVNNQLVLFSNLTSGNNRVYKVSGVGSSLVWTVQSVWPNGFDPQVGDDVIIAHGVNFGLQRGIFDGSDFVFNDVVRFFNGTDYWEMSSLKTLNLYNNFTDTIFSIGATASENIIIDFSIERGSSKETGTLHITHDGANVSLSQSGTYIGASGVSFAGNISVGVFYLTYTTDSSGSAGVLKYFVRRWSDSPGGPGGIPSYTVSGGGGGAAAGNTSEIQFNTAGSLDADSTFKYDKTNKILNLGSLELTNLVGPIVLTDNTTNGTAFSFVAASYPFVIVDFSILRDGKYQVGRMLIANDGTNASFSSDSISTADTQTTFNATVSGANVLVRYTTVATGFNANLKYALRRWG